MRPLVASMGRRNLVEYRMASCATSSAEWVGKLGRKFAAAVQQDSKSKLDPYCSVTIETSFIVT